MPDAILPTATDEEKDALAAISPGDVQEARVWTARQEPRQTPLKVADLVEAEEETEP